MTKTINTSKYEIMRAEAEWQRAGAYAVRIEGMNRQHGISLREEFDEYDCDGTRYIVILDEGYPVATCRFYQVAKDAVSLGRVVVLPEYRGLHLGSMIIEEAEKWIADLGYSRILIDSRVETTGFYQKHGYNRLSDAGPEPNSVFMCVAMNKELSEK